MFSKDGLRERRAWVEKKESNDKKGGKQFDSKVRISYDRRWPSNPSRTFQTVACTKKRAPLTLVSRLQLRSLSISSSKTRIPTRSPTSESLAEGKREGVQGSTTTLLKCALTAQKGRRLKDTEGRPRKRARAVLSLSLSLSLQGYVAIHVLFLQLVNGVDSVVAVPYNLRKEQRKRGEVNLI